MRRLLVVVLALLVGVGALGYWRGWFSVTKGGKFDVQVDQVKVNQDKKTFSKAVGEKAKTMKDQVASLWEKSEGLTGDDKARAQKELGELKKKHDRLERQIKELEAASQDKFESIKQDLSKTLEEVEKKIEELKDNLGKGKDK
jgi:DNA anti-recombination protein RmuC